MMPTSNESNNQVRSKMAELPAGWGNRHNQMSEHDIKLGGAAATKFTGAKSAYEHDAEIMEYKNSDSVRNFYLNNFSKGSSEALKDLKSGSHVPDFWEERQKQRELETKQMGVYSKQAADIKLNERNQKITQSTIDILPPEIAMVQIATHTLEKMAKSLEGRTIKIPLKEKAEFAKALKHIMDVLAKDT